MAIGRVHKPAVCVGQQELGPAQKLPGGALFLDDQSPHTLVPENQFRGLGARLDLDGFGFTAQHEALHRGNLTGGDGGSRLQALDHDLTRRIGVEGPIAGAHRRAIAGSDLEADPGQRLPVSALDVFADRQSHPGIVLKIQVVAAACARARICTGGDNGPAGDGIGPAFQHDGLGGGV